MMEMDAASTASKEEEDGQLPGEESSKGDMDSSQERKNEEEAKKANVSDEKDDNAQLKEETNDPQSVNKDTANAKKCPENDQNKDADCSNSEVSKDSVKPSSSSDPGTAKDDASREQQSAIPAETAKSASTTSAVPSSTATLDKCSSSPLEMSQISDKTPDSGAEVNCPVAPDVVSSPSKEVPAETPEPSVSLPDPKGNGSSSMVTTTSSGNPAACTSPSASSVVSSDDSVVKKSEESQPSVSSQNENSPRYEEASTAGSSSEASDKQSVVIDSSADPLPENNSASQSVTSSQVTPSKPSTTKSSSVSSSIVSSSTSEKCASPSVNTPSQSTKTPSAAVSSSSISASKMQSSSISSSSITPTSAVSPSPPEVSSSKPFPDKNPKPKQSAPKPSVSSPKPSPTVNPSKFQSSSQRPSGASSLPVKLTRPQFSSSPKSSPTPSTSGKSSVPSGGSGLTSNSPSTQSPRRPFHSSPKPSSTHKPTTSSSPTSSTSTTPTSPLSTTTSTPSSSNPTPSASGNLPASSPNSQQSASPSPSTSNASSSQPEVVPPVQSSPQNAQQESSEGENAALPSTDFSVPDIRRDCPTEPSSPPTSIVPDVLRTGSEEENRQLGRMLNNLTPFGGGIPAPIMPDLCQRGENSTVAIPPPAPRPSSEANVDLLCPAGVPGNLNNVEEGQADSSNIPTENVDAVETGEVMQENVSEEVKPTEPFQADQQKGVCSSSSSEVGASSSSPVVKVTGSSPLKENKDEFDNDKMEVASESDVSSSSKEAGVLDAGSDKSNSGSRVDGDSKTDDAEVPKDNDNNVSAMSSDSVDLKGEENVEKIATVASDASAVAPVESMEEVTLEKEGEKSVGDEEIPKSNKEEEKELETGPVLAESSEEKMTVERGEAGKDSASAEEEATSSLMVPPPIAHLPADVIMKDSGKDLPQKEEKEPKRDEAGPAIPLLKNTKSTTEENNDDPMDITPISKDSEATGASVKDKVADSPKSDVKKDNSDKDDNERKGKLPREKSDCDNITKSKDSRIQDKSTREGSVSQDVNVEKCLESQGNLGNSSCNKDSDKKSDVDPKCSMNISVEETVKKTLTIHDVVSEEKTEKAVKGLSESSNPTVSDSCETEKNNDVVAKKSEIVGKEGNDTASVNVTAETDISVSEEKKIKDKHKVDEDAVGTKGNVISDLDSIQKQSSVAQHDSENSAETFKETDLKESLVKSENVMSTLKDNSELDTADNKKHCLAASSSRSEDSEKMSVINLQDSKSASSQVQIKKDSNEKEDKSSKQKILDNNHVEAVHSKLEKSKKIDILHSSGPVISEKKINLPSPIVEKKKVNAVNSMEEKEIANKTTPKELLVTSSSEIPKLDSLKSESHVSLKSNLKEKDQEEVILSEKSKDNNSASVDMHSISVSSVCKTVPAILKASSLAGDKKEDGEPILPSSDLTETNVCLTSTENSVVSNDTESQENKSQSSDLDNEKESTQESCLDLVNVTEEKNVLVKSDVEIVKSVPTAPPVNLDLKSAAESSSSNKGRSQKKEDSVSKISSHVVSEIQSTDKTLEEEKHGASKLGSSLSVTTSREGSEKPVVGDKKIDTPAIGILKSSTSAADCFESKQMVTNTTEKDIGDKEVIESQLIVSNEKGEEKISSKDIPIIPIKGDVAPESVPALDKSTHSGCLSELETCVSPEGKKQAISENVKESSKDSTKTTDVNKVTKPSEEISSGNDKILEETSIKPQVLSDPPSKYSTVNKKSSNNEVNLPLGDELSSSAVMISVEETSKENISSANKVHSQKNKAEKEKKSVMSEKVLEKDSSDIAENFGKSDPPNAEKKMSVKKSNEDKENSLEIKGGSRHEVLNAEDKVQSNSTPGKTHIKKSHSEEGDLSKNSLSVDGDNEICDKVLSNENSHNPKGEDITVSGCVISGELNDAKLSKVTPVDTGKNEIVHSPSKERVSSGADLQVFPLDDVSDKKDDVNDSEVKVGVNQTTSTVPHGVSLPIARTLNSTSPHPEGESPNKYPSEGKNVGFIPIDANVGMLKTKQDSPSPLPLLSDSDSSDGSKFKKRADVKQLREKSILGITEKLAVANQMRQQKQTTAEVQSKEYVSPRKMPGLIEMGSAKASRRKNLALKEDLKAKKAKLLYAPDSNESSENKAIHDSPLKNVSEANIGKFEVIPKVPNLSIVVEKQPPMTIPIEIPLYKSPSKDLGMPLAASSCNIMDLSSKREQNPSININSKVNFEISSSPLQKDTIVFTTPKNSLEIKPIEEDYLSPSKNVQGVNIEARKEDGGFKSPRMKRISGKDKTMIDSPILPGGPTTRTRTTYKPSTSPKPVMKVDSGKDKGSPNSKNVKSPLKNDDLLVELEPKRKSVEVSTEPFTKETESKILDHSVKDEVISIKSSPSQSPIRSSKLLEVIRVAGEKDIVKVNDVEVMREPVGVSTNNNNNSPLSLLRKTASNIPGYSLSVSAHEQRKEPSVETKNVPETVQVDTASAGSKFPPGNTESWEFVAKVGEVELLRESPRAVPKATPPPLTITVESTGKKTKDKNKSGRPPSMPPPAKMSDFIIPPNLMEQTVLAHQNLRNNPLEVVVGIGSRPEGLDLRGQVPPMGIPITGAPIWQLPVDERGRSAIPRSAGVDFTTGRSSSAGENSSETDSDKRKKGSKARSGPPPKWQSQEADLLSVKLDGHPLGTWSPRAWRSIPPTSMGLWQSGYNYGFPTRPKGPMEPRGSRSVSPPQAGKDSRGMEQMPEDLSNNPVQARGRSRDSPHSFRPPFAHPATSFPGGTPNFSNAGVMSYPSPSHVSKNSNVFNLAKSTSSASSTSDTAMNLTMCKQASATPPPLPVLSSSGQQPSRQSSIPVNLVKSRSSSPKTQVQTAPNSDSRGAVLPGGIIVPNLPLIFGRDYSHPTNTPSGRVSHCSAEENRDTETTLSQVRCSSEPPRDHVPERTRDGTSAFLPTNFMQRPSSANVNNNYQPPRPASSTSIIEVTSRQSTTSETNLLPGGVVIPNLFSGNSSKPGEEQWNYENAKSELPVRSASALAQFHSEEPTSKSSTPKVTTPIPAPPPTTNISTPTPPPKSGPGRRGGRSETPPPDKYNFRVEEAHVVRSSENGGGGPGGNKLYACDICSGVYRRAFSLKRHYLRAHINYCHLSERDLSNCGIVVGDKMAVQTGGSGRRPYVHTALPKSSETTTDDDEEKANNNVGGRRTLLRDLFRCHTCGVCFDEKKRLKAHLMEHQCGSNRPSLLRQHAATHTPPAVIPKAAPLPKQHPSSPTPVVFLCAYCDKRFSSAAVRRRHRKLHESSPGPHPCYLCETSEEARERPGETSSFAQLEDLRAHMASAHKEVYHSCDLCGERLPSILALEEHAESHRSHRKAADGSEEEEEEEEAELSRAASANAAEGSVISESAQAAASAQGEEEEFRYTCGVCQKMFTNYVNMCRHRRLAHGASQAKAPGRKGGATAGVKQGGVDSGSSSRSQSPVVVSQTGTGERGQHRDLIDGEPSSSSSSSVPSPCPYPPPYAANDPETLFYTRLAGNIRDNLLNYLDGKLDRENSNKKIKEDEYESTVENGDDSTKIEPYLSWEKYNFPKDFQQMSFWDISTQLVVRNNMIRASNTPPVEQPSVPAFPQTLALVETSKAAEITKDIKTEDSVEVADIEGEWPGLSGEWIRPRSYICCACASRFADLWSLEDHQYSKHPNVWCTHLEVEDGAVVLPGTPKLSPGSTSLAVSFLGDLLCRKPLGPRGALLAAPSIPPTLNNGLDSPSAKCTKCSRLCPSLPDLHSHMLECGGDLAWAAWAGGSSPAASSRRNSKKWRPFGSRRRRQRGRRGMKRNIPSSPVKMHRARHRGTDSDSIQRMIANLPAKRATRRVIQFNEDEIKTRSQATIHSVSFTGTYVRVSGYRTSQGVKPGPPTAAKRGRPPKNPVPPSTPVSSEGSSNHNASPASVGSPSTASPASATSPSVIVKKGRGRPPGSKSKSNLPVPDVSAKRRMGESFAENSSPEADRYSLVKRSRMGTSPINQHQSSTTTPNAPGEPYICKGCGTVFDNASSCERHGKKCVFRRQMPSSPTGDGTRSSSSGSARPVHSCPHCGKNFTYATPMEKHVRACQGGASPKGQPVQVRRSTASDSMEDSILEESEKGDELEESKKDWEVEGTEESMPAEEVIQTPPQEPDMPQLQKEEPVASPLPKDEDIPVLTPVAPDEGDEKKEPIDESSVEAEMHVEISAKEVSAITVYEDEEESVPADGESSEPSRVTEIVEEVEIKVEVTSPEETQPADEVMPEDIQENIKSTDDDSIPIETGGDESKECKSDKREEEEVEVKHVQTSGKRTRGSSVGRQVSKKNKPEDDIVEEIEEVEPQKKKPGRKSTGSLPKQKTPKASKSSQVTKPENEIQKVEDNEEESVALNKLEVDEIKEEVKEISETPIQKDTKDSAMDEKDISHEQDEEEKHETKSKRGRKPKSQKGAANQETVAKNAEDKQTSSVTTPEKISSENKKESPKPSEVSAISEENSKDEATVDVKSKSVDDDTEMKSSISAKEDMNVEEDSSAPILAESVKSGISHDEKEVDESEAKSKEVDDSKETEEEVEEEKKEEEDDDEDDKKESDAKKNSKLRGTKGSKGKVTKANKKKKKKFQELKKEVENFWCDVCQMGYSSAFNLVKHGMSQKHKWNLRLGKEKLEKEEEEKLKKKEDETQDSEKSKEHESEVEKLEKNEDNEGSKVEAGSKSSSEVEEGTKDEVIMDASEESTLEKSTNETSVETSIKSGNEKSPKSKDGESVDSVKSKGALSKSGKGESLDGESDKKDSSIQSVINEGSTNDGGAPSKDSESTSSEEASKGSDSKNRDGVTGQDQLPKAKNLAGKETKVKSSAKETQSNITKVSPEAVVAAAPESATVIEGTKGKSEDGRRNSWTEAPIAQPASQEFVQPAAVPTTTGNSSLEWDNSMVPPAPMQAQTGGPQQHHQGQQDGWGAYGGWEAPSTDPNPPPSPGLWRYQPPNVMPWGGEPQHSLSPIPRVPAYTEDPAPVTHPSPPNASLGSILDSVNRILGEEESSFDSTRIHAATAPEEEYGGVGLFGEGSLAELQRAMGATDEEMAMLQQLGTGPLDFVYDNNAGLTSAADGGPEGQDQTGPLPNAELVDLDNQPASVTMVEGPLEEAETAAVPSAAINASDAMTADGLASKRKRSGPLPSKCKRFPPPNREGRVWRGGRRPALAQTSLASAHLLISQYEKKEMVCPVCNRHFLGLAALETHVSWVHKLKDAKQHILEGETGYIPGKKTTQTTSNSIRELVVGRAGSGPGGVVAASSPTPSRRLPCFVCKELYSDVISLNHHIAQQHLRRRAGEGGAVPEIDGNLKSQMTSALGDLLGRALANIRNGTNPNNPNAKPGQLTSAAKSPSLIFPKLNLLGKSQEKASPSAENPPRKSFGGPSSCDGNADFLTKMEPSSESPEVTLFRRDDVVDPLEWSSDGEDSAKGHEIDLPEESITPSFHHVCPYCGDRFQKLSSRNRHISVAHRDPTCLDLMRVPRNASHDSTDFDDLLNRTKDGDGTLPKEEPSEDLLDTARRSNHHPCPGCQLSFLRHSQLEAHMKRAHNGSDSQLPDTSDSMMECPICRESMNHFLKLCKHVKAKHREWSINCFTTEMHHHLILRKESPEESMVIRKKFLVKMKAFPVLRMASPTPSSKSSEEESHMDPDPKGNYLCSVCGVNFKSPQGVIRHLNLEHNSNHLEGALPMQKIFQRNAAKEYRGRTGGGNGSDIKAKAEAALRELNLSQKFKLTSMSGSKGVTPNKGSSSRKSDELLGSGGNSRGRGRGSGRRGRGRRGGRSVASSDVEKSLFDVYEFEDDDDDNEDVSSRVGSADGGSSRVDSECGGDDEEEEEEVIGDEDSKGNTPASIKGKRASVDSSSSDVKYTCHSCGKGYKSLSAFWKHTKGVRGLCASGSSSPKSAERSQDVASRGNKASGSKKAPKEDEELSDAESEVGGRVLRRLRGSGDNVSESLDGGSLEVETSKKGDKAPKKGKRKAEEEKKGAFPGGETVRTYGGKRVKQQQAEERKGRSSDEGSAGRRSTGASEAAFDALRGGGAS